MLALRRLLAGVIVCAAVACGPKEGESNTDEPTSASAATTSVTETSPTTTASSGSSDSTGTSPDPTACEPPEQDSMLTAVCAARDEMNCNGVIEPKGSDLCQWVATKSYSHGAAACEGPTIGGACIALRYYGDGCESTTICGSDVEGDVLFRTDSECRTQVIEASFCGYDVLGWGKCLWDVPATESAPNPLPTGGPAVCNCAC